MFWTDQGKQSKIESAWMNGEHRTVLVSQDLGWPNGLSIDYLNDDRIYWSDSKEDVIETIKYDGTDRRVIINEGRERVSLHINNCLTYFQCVLGCG